VVGPLRQNHVVYLDLVLSHPVLVVVDVDVELRQSVELGDELAQVSGRTSRIVPRPQVAVK